MFSWLPAKEISIKELEQIFIEHLNGTYEGEYKVLLEVPDNADKNILNSSAEMIEFQLVCVHSGWLLPCLYFTIRQGILT